MLEAGHLCHLENLALAHEKLGDDLIGASCLEHVSWLRELGWDKSLIFKLKKQSSEFTENLVKAQKDSLSSDTLRKLNKRMDSLNQWRTTISSMADEIKLHFSNIRERVMGIKDGYGELCLLIREESLVDDWEKL